MPISPYLYCLITYSAGKLYPQIQYHPVIGIENCMYSGVFMLQKIIRPVRSDKRPRIIAQKKLQFRIDVSCDALNGQSVNNGFLLSHCQGGNWIF